MKVISYSKKLRRAIATANAIKKNFGQQASVIIKVLGRIKAIENFSDLWTIPGNCHELSFQAKGVYVLWLKHPLRLVFRLVEEYKAIEILAIEDLYTTRRISA